MVEHHPFKWRHFQSDIILLCVRWYLRYSLRYRDLEEIILEHGLHVDPTTIYRSRPALRARIGEKMPTSSASATNNSWRVDETYINIKGVWVSLYRAVDSAGNTLDFWLNATRDTEAAKRFFNKTLTATHTVTPRVINVDKHAAYPKARKRAQSRGNCP